MRRRIRGTRDFAPPGGYDWRVRQEATTGVRQGARLRERRTGPPEPEPRLMVDGRWLESLRSAAALIAPGLLVATVDAGGGVRINEIRIDQPGADEDEYVELAADPGTSLDGYTYVVIGDANAGSGVIEVLAMPIGVEPGPVGPPRSAPWHVRS